MKAVHNMQAVRRLAGMRTTGAMRSMPVGPCVGGQPGIHAGRASRTYAALLLALSSLVLSACGTNTASPVYPIFTLVSVGTPAIVDLVPVTTVDPPQFKVSFYVTNREPEFIGYNLYMTQTYTAPDSGLAGKPYLPDGIEPSFAYSAADASTLAANLKTQTITGPKAAPSPVFFLYCRRYYFTLRAVLRNGTTSTASPQVSGCLLDSTFCPTAASCE